jgi:hypothetical protein
MPARPTCTCVLEVGLSLNLALGCEAAKIPDTTILVFDLVLVVVI